MASADYPEELLGELLQIFTSSVNLVDFLLNTDPSTSCVPRLPSTMVPTEKNLKEFIGSLKNKMNLDEVDDVVLHRCRLCGVFLSPLVKDEIRRHLYAVHRDHLQQQLTALPEGHSKNGRREMHPVWSHFYRYNNNTGAVCLLCLRAVKCACTSNLLKHFDYHHMDLARKLRVDWSASREERISRRRQRRTAT